MARHAVPLGRIFGITIDLDYSWFLVFGLLTWVLAVNYYPAEFKDWSPAEYWLMGAFTAIMLFVSVLLHELGHSLVAQRLGFKVPRITLFIFGGVSEISTEPTSASVEFWIAVAGPVVSILLGAIFWELRPVFVNIPPLLALTKYLALLNLLVGAFNLIPGFPLDGGRVFRAIVWAATGNFARATAIATLTGRLFGFLVIALGVGEALRGDFYNGLWTAFTGWYLESAAMGQAQQQVGKNLAQGVTTHAATGN